MVHRLAITVAIEGPAVSKRARSESLARQLVLPLAESGQIEGGQIEAGLILAYHNDILEIRDLATKPGKGVCVDFRQLNPQREAQRGGFSRSQPLARAIGRNAKAVLDATAGLGHDAALLACMGYEVTAVERSPILAALLTDALRRALEDPALAPFFKERLRIVNADARQFISSATSEFDAIYLDPMFPAKRKSALAKKEIRMVRELVGDDEDAAELLAITRQTHARVAVKRSTTAPPLAPGAIAVIKSKLVRYDIYKRAQIPG